MLRYLDYVVVAVRQRHARVAVHIPGAPRRHKVLIPERVHSLVFVTPNFPELHGHQVPHRRRLCPARAYGTMHAVIHAVIHAQCDMIHDASHGISLNQYGCRCELGQSGAQIHARKVLTDSIETGMGLQEQLTSGQLT